VRRMASSIFEKHDSGGEATAGKEGSDGGRKHGLDLRACGGEGLGYCGGRGERTRKNSPTYVVLCNLLNLSPQLQNIWIQVPGDGRK
jgi:hypothetical protein